MAGTFENPKFVQEEVDILMIGGGMACCGAAYEIGALGRRSPGEKGVNLKIKLVEKRPPSTAPAPVGAGSVGDQHLLRSEQDPGTMPAWCRTT